MLVIGLTGSIGMGKSTAAARFKERGIAVFDADAEVHTLYEGPLAEEIEAVFPGTTAGGRVDRAKLSAALLKEPNSIKMLEALVHPRVRAKEREFLQREATKGAKFAVLELPLLFEAGGAESVDCVIVVSAPEAVQRSRVLARTGMTPAKLEQLLSRQMKDAEKRRRAHFVVDTGGTPEACHAQIDVILDKLNSRQGTAFEKFWG